MRQLAYKTIGYTRETLESFHIALKRKQYGLDYFFPNVCLNIDTEHFSLTTANNVQDLVEVLKFRHDVFIRDGLDKKTLFGLDVDEYDAFADHLIIREKLRGTIVGTYRLLFSNYVESFYSATEFKMDAFLELPGTKLELGRACIRDGYRDGPAIYMLWKGLAAYIMETQPKYLFGCSSVKNMNPRVIANVEKYLDKYRTDTPIDVRKAFEFPQLEKRMAALSPEEKSEAKSMLPPLLRTYLNAGAEVAGPPALDRAFKCTDFLTIMDLTKMSSSFRRKFFA